MQETTLELSNKIATENNLNPNGDDIPFTYCVSTHYSNYHLIQQLHAKGHEIAVHTMTHTTDLNSSYDEWHAEINGTRNALSELGQIPIEDIVGFCAPFLKHSDLSIAVLHQSGFLYDSSIPESPGHLSVNDQQCIWPYTLDTTGAQACHVDQCPPLSCPGLWEIPMWGLVDQAGRVAGFMDPTGDSASLESLLKYNFNQRYNGNRIPLGIFLHAAWLANPSNAEALNQFIAYANSFNDVWFITNHQLIKWIKNPVSAEAMTDWEHLQRPDYSITEEKADGLDNDNDGEINKDSVKSCSYLFSNFITTAVDCPIAYPEPEFVPFCQVSTSEVLSDSVNLICSEPPWDPDHTYTGGETVAYNERIYRSL